MRHAILTCKNHPNLRWSCKECAVNADGSYNGSRNIFFDGEPTGEGMYSDGSGLHCTQYIYGKDAEGKTTGLERFVTECDCPASDLIRAPEDALVTN